MIHYLSRFTTCPKTVVEIFAPCMKVDVEVALRVVSLVLAGPGLMSWQLQGGLQVLYDSKTKWRIMRVSSALVWRAGEVLVMTGTVGQWGLCQVHTNVAGIKKKVEGYTVANTSETLNSGN